MVFCDAVASAGPYANNLHLAPDRYPRQHLITQFLQARCCSWRLTNSIKALKAIKSIENNINPQSDFPVSIRLHVCVKFKYLSCACIKHSFLSLINNGICPEVIISHVTSLLKYVSNFAFHLSMCFSNTGGVWTATAFSKSLLGVDFSLCCVACTVDSYGCCH